MSLVKLKAAPILLVKDDGNKNIVPLLRELNQLENNVLNMFCYEQPVSLWRTVFAGKSDVRYYEEFDPDQYDKYTSEKCSLLIDSVNQMALSLGWHQCLKNIRNLHQCPNVSQLILVFHRDCISQVAMQLHLDHIASAIVSYDTTNPCKIHIQLKRSGKLVKTEEILSYDARTSTLKSTIVEKEVKKEDEPEKPLPSSLSTFKIEVDQTEKLEKYKLKLPYMSKIHEGESKVYYEPDAVDDWDEEDPDEDLDI